MKQVYNPYLPLYEYIPDGEPHVFGDRVYIYGSHDYAGGDIYCPGHYTVWSAPVSDLKEWRCDGVSYRRDQDPTNSDDHSQLWAPDVCEGSDGRYYLYYCFAFVPEIGVAVSDSPAGPFEFYGHVKYAPDVMGGKELNEHLPFDPAIFVDDDKRVYLYYGFSPIETSMPGEEELREQGMSEEEIKERLQMMEQMKPSPGAMVVELEPDMVTMKGEPRMMIPGGSRDAGTDFEGHGFFEASSMRKINGRYYFVYSSRVSHELCYAISDKPDAGFAYGGVIVSNGDIGYQGNTVPKNMMGNNHGGLVCVEGQCYIFYHRQTHATESSRQGCAEPVKILPDGSIPQVEITSCGLNGGPLQGQGEYPAAIACYLTSKTNVKKIVYGQSLQDVLPYIYEEQRGADETEHIHYVANISDGVKVGYKYFDFQGVKSLTVTLRGTAEGTLSVYTDEEENGKAGEAQLSLRVGGSIEGADWEEIEIALSIPDGIHGIFLKYTGTGTIQLRKLYLI